jgi:hypothetical protein
MSSSQDITNLIAKLSPRSVTGGNMYVNTPTNSEVIVSGPQGPQAVPIVGSARSPGKLSPSTSAMLGVNYNTLNAGFTPGPANNSLTMLPSMESLSTQSPSTYSPVSVSPRAAIGSTTPRSVSVSSVITRPASPTIINRPASPVIGRPQSVTVPLPVPTVTISPTRNLPRISSVTGVSTRSQVAVSPQVLRDEGRLVADESRLVQDERQLIADEVAAPTSARPVVITPTYSNSTRPGYTAQPLPRGSPVGRTPQPISIAPIQIRPISPTTDTIDIGLPQTAIRSPMPVPIPVQRTPVNQVSSASPQSYRGPTTTSSGVPLPIPVQRTPIAPIDVTTPQSYQVPTSTPTGVPLPIPVQRTPMASPNQGSSFSAPQQSYQGSPALMSTVPVPIPVQRTPMTSSGQGYTGSPVQIRSPLGASPPAPSSPLNIPTMVTTSVPVPVNVSPQVYTPTPVNTVPLRLSPTGGSKIPMPGSVRVAPMPTPIIRTPIGGTSPTRTPAIASPGQMSTLPLVSSPGRVSVLGPAGTEKAGINDLNDFLRSHHYIPIKYTGTDNNHLKYVKAYSPLGPACYISIDIDGQATITTNDMKLFVVDKDSVLAKSSEINAASSMVTPSVGALIECRDGICAITSSPNGENNVTTYVTQSRMTADDSRYDDNESLLYPIVCASAIQVDGLRMAQAIYDASLRLRRDALKEQLDSLTNFNDHIMYCGQALTRFTAALKQDIDTAPDSLISVNTSALMDKRMQLMNKGAYPVPQSGVDNSAVDASNQAILSTEAWLKQFSDMEHKHINLANSLSANIDLVKQLKTRIYDHTAQLFLSAFTTADPALTGPNFFKTWGLPDSFATVTDFPALTDAQWEAATSGHTPQAHLASALRRAVSAISS